MSPPPLGAIVPARPLARPSHAVEHPPAEFEPESDDPAERAAARERGKLLQAGQMDLVLDDAVLESARLRLLQQRVRFRQRRRHRLLAIDVLAGGDRLFDRMPTRCSGRCRIEEDRVLAARPAQHRDRWSSPRSPCVRATARNAIGIAADQQQARQQAVVPDRQTAFR